MGDAYSLCATALDHVNDAYESSQGRLLAQQQNVEHPLSEAALAENKRALAQAGLSMKIWTNEFDVVLGFFGRAQAGEMSNEDLLAELVESRANACVGVYGDLEKEVRRGFDRDGRIDPAICTDNAEFQALLEYSDQGKTRAQENKAPFLIYDHLILLVWRQCDKSRISERGRAIINQSYQLWDLLSEKRSPYDFRLDRCGVWGAVYAHYKILQSAPFRKRLSQTLTGFACTDRGMLNEAVKFVVMPEQAHPFLKEAMAEEKFQKKLLESLAKVDGENLRNPQRFPLQQAPFWTEAKAEEERSTFLEAGLSVGKKGEKKKKKHTGKRKKKKRPGKKKEGRPAAASQVAPDTESSEEEVYETEALTAAEETATEQIVSEKKDDPEEVPPLPVPEEKVEDPAALAAQKEHSPRFQFDYPRAVRVFNPALIGQERSLLAPLHKGQQDFVDLLFGGDQPHNIAFKDFSQFWMSLGGRLEGEGTSHVHIVAPDGTPLWGTFIPHGKQSYGPRTIQNLRAAAYWVGCHPDK